MTDRDSGAPTIKSLIDFHAHWLPRELVGDRPPAGLSGPISTLWPLLTDRAAAVEAIERDAVETRLFSVPLEMLERLGGEPSELVKRGNDLLAEFVADHAPRVGGLATVDAFAGEHGAEEARRAVDELGFRGLFVAAVSGQLLLDAPQARPTLEFAAERRLAVFAHPVNPPLLEPRFAGVPGAGHALGRASESAISTLALLSSGRLNELPGLRIVLAQLGSVALLLAHYLDRQPGESPPAGGRWKPSDDRSRLYLDTAGLEPLAIRLALDSVGPEHLLLGSDWPIDVELSQDVLADALLAGGVAVEDLDRVAAGNARGLLSSARVLQSSDARAIQ